MSLAVIGFNFRNNTYLVFDTDTQTAKLMTRTELLNQNISEAKIEDGLIKPIHPESRYFQEELYSSQMPQLQGYIVEALANNTFKVYTNQAKLTQLTAEEISKLYTVLNANLSFPIEGIKVDVISGENNQVPTLAPVLRQEVQSTITQNKNNVVDAKTEELLNIFRQDIQGYCVTDTRDWPMLYHYKVSEVLNALKAWVNQDYPNLRSFFNYFLKYPLLYPAEGKTPLLERKSYIYAMYNLLKAQIIYDSAIQEIKRGVKVPTLPLTVRPISFQLKWERKLLAKLTEDQQKYLRYIVDPNSIRNYSNSASSNLSNVNLILRCKTTKAKLTNSYVEYNTKLYERYLSYTTTYKAQGKSVHIESLNSVAYLESLATLNLHIRDNEYKDYCFIRMSSGEYLKLTRPRTKEDFDIIIPKVEWVQLPEVGVKCYEFGPIKFEGTTLTVQIAEMLLHYANRGHKHYEYYIEETNELFVNRISDRSASKFILDDLSDVNDLLEYMYS